MENNFQTPSKFNKKENSSLEFLKIPPSPFLEKLGYGTGVTVWKLQHSSKNNQAQSPWAIKNVRSNINKQLTNKFQSLLNNEANILKSLKHENIIGFRGYLKSEDGRNCLAMEIGGESLGNLIELRHEKGLGPFTAKIIIKVAYNIAKALKYLHEDIKILHADLKSYNVVVKDDFNEIKLCDFGVSISLNDPDIKKKFVGTPIYSAPECQEGVEGLITSKADIFSLGLIIWEMISLYPPHTQDLLNENMGNSLLDNSDFNFEDELKENYGTQPPLPSVDLDPEYNSVLELFYCCTEQNPDKRPSANDLVNWLEVLIKK